MSGSVPNIISSSGEVHSRIFTTNFARHRHVAGPMLEERESYLAHLLNAGRSYKGARQTASLLNEVIAQLDLPRVGAVHDDEIKSAAALWCKLYDREHYRSRTRDFEATARGFLRFLGQFRTTTDRPSGFLEEFEAFAEFVLQHERYSSTTMRLVVANTRRFLSWLCTKAVALDSVKIETIEQFVLEKGESGTRHATICHYLSSLKVFFEFAESRGWNRERLNRRIDKPKRKRSHEDRRGPPWKQIRRVLAALDDSKPTECRAKAILILAAVYGLRSAEISRLLLSDLDWSTGVITVRRSKRGRTQLFPIQPELRDAVGRYLEKVRPRCRHSEVFITLNSPYRPTMNLTNTLSNTLHSKGVFAKRHGLHAFRHACATELLRQGTSLKGIADFLGHTNLQSVSIYAHCGSRALRKVADFEMAEVL